MHSLNHDGSDWKWSMAPGMTTFFRIPKRCFSTSMIVSRSVAVGKIVYINFINIIYMFVRESPLNQ